MATEQAQLRRLQRIEVDGLFGIYHHHIDLKLDDRVTLLHGPNGVGKTTVLKMVDALLTDNIWYFLGVPFERLSLVFHDGSKLDLAKEKVPQGDLKAGEIRLTTNGKTRSTSFDSVLSPVEAIAAEVEYLQRDRDGWIDLRDGEWLADSDVVKRYDLPSRRSFRAVEGTPSDEDADWLREFLGATDSHFIEAQRLAQSPPMPRWPNRLKPAVPRVVERSRELKRRIDDTMADYGRRAQTLDQSFPQRLLERSNVGNSLSGADIQDRMTNLERNTEELKEIGILDEAPIPQFQFVDKIEPSQTGVMTLYVEDTEQKLHVLEDLASRARLLLKSLNGKFRHKTMRIDREQGLVVDGEEGTLTLDSLSSGEQHELILHYDLLFRVQPNTVVLLDEPELSLHIEWQSKFLSDLTDIVQLSGFDALLATHSPHIVGDRDDLMVELSG